MLDSTIVRARQQAATGRKEGEDKALGRSRIGLSTKIHLLVNGLGEPVAFRLTAAQASEFAEALPLLAGRQAEAMLADRCYDSNAIVAAIVAAIEAMGATAVIASKVGRKVQRHHDRILYKLRSRIARCFNRLKQVRGLATRYCKRRLYHRRHRLLNAPTQTICRYNLGDVLSYEQLWNRRLML